MNARQKKRGPCFVFRLPLWPTPPSLLLPIGPQAEYKRSRIFFCASAYSSAGAIERPDIALDIHDASVAPNEDDLRQARAVQIGRSICRAVFIEWSSEYRILEVSTISRWWVR